MLRPLIASSSLAASAALFVALLPAAPVFSQTEPVIIQPGAPGEPSRRISAEEASDLAGIEYTQADVEFMQGMIAHHAQAVIMTDMLATRSEREDMHTLAKRISLSQEDEIKMMQEWLKANRQDTTAMGDHHDHDGMLMPGMLTPEQLSQLENTSARDFDRLFLELMIAHHQGALVMVDDLLSKSGAAQESTIFAFTADITSDQSAEIDRMGALLAGLSNDPRVHLTAGFMDAGQAVVNMELVSALPKPTGFFAPDAPQGVAIPAERKAAAEQPEESEEAEQDDVPADAPTDSDAAGDHTEQSDEDKTAEEAAAEKAEEEQAQASRRRMAAILNFANSDIAFDGNILYEGNFHGFNTYNIEDPTAPRLQGSVVCPGGQGDVSVVGNLLIMSVEQTRGRLDCGLQGVSEPSSAERFRGIRIFDISNREVPQQVAAVQTCRGSHTHTVVTDPDDQGNIYVFGSGTSSVRPGDELEGCSDAPPGEDENTALFSIDVIQIPVLKPQDAKVVNRPRIFADSETGKIAGLWKGGTHGTGKQRTAQTNQCHDITVFPELGLAAGACSGNGILLDISDPEHPKRLDQVIDEGFAYWHSATFNNQGTKVIFTDEWGGGMRPRCRASDPKQWGADAIFDIVDRKLEFRGYYKLPAPQTENENCVAHNGSLIPVPGRDIMVQAWYQGGISIFDFTDSSAPFEIAFFDRGPIDANQLMMGGHWSAYWHNGYIYGTEIARGLDVLKLVPSEYLSPNEIAAAELIEVGVNNAQQQQRISWPASPVVARAYLDQLTRSGSLSEQRIASLNAVLRSADKALGNSGRSNGRVAQQLQGLAADLENDAASASQSNRDRIERLADTVKELATSLR